MCIEMYLEGKFTGHKFDNNNVSLCRPALTAVTTNCHRRAHNDSDKKPIYSYVYILICKSFYSLFKVREGATTASLYNSEQNEWDKLVV